MMNEKRRNSKGTMTKREVTETRSSPPTVIGRTSPMGLLSNQGGPLAAPRSGRRSSSPRLSPCPLSPSPRTSPFSTSPRASISIPMSPRPSPSSPISVSIGVVDHCQPQIGGKPKRSPPVVPPRNSSMKKLCNPTPSGESRTSSDEGNRFPKFQTIDQSCTNPLLERNEERIPSFHQDEPKVDPKIKSERRKTPPKCVISNTDLGTDGDDEYEETGDFFDFEEEPELTEIANNILRQLKERELARDQVNDPDGSLGGMDCCGGDEAHGEGVDGLDYNEDNDEDEIDRMRRREVITVQSVLKNAENMDDLTDHESDDESLPATYENKTALGDDLLFLASMPELCGE